MMTETSSQISRQVLVLSEECIYGFAPVQACYLTLAAAFTYSRKYNINERYSRVVLSPLVRFWWMFRHVRSERIKWITKTAV